MEGNVVVFDRANQRIGFAPSNMSHPDVGPCGKKSPRGTGKGFFEDCVLEFKVGVHMKAVFWLGSMFFMQISR